MVVLTYFAFHLSSEGSQSLSYKLQLIQIQRVQPLDLPPIAHSPSEHYIRHRSVADYRHVSGYTVIMRTCGVISMLTAVMSRKAHLESRTSSKLVILFSMMGPL